MSNGQAVYGHAFDGLEPADGQQDGKISSKTPAPTSLIPLSLQYRLQSGQTPVVRPNLHLEYGFDNFPNGMNAVVAVISYTGYDMEDAMILNKSAHERGFGYGTVYKSDIFNLQDEPGAVKSLSMPSLHFGLGNDVMKKTDHPALKTVDTDGYPMIGAKVQPGDPLCGYTDDLTGKTRFHKYKGDEVAYVDEVRILGGWSVRPWALIRTHTTYPA